MNKYQIPRDDARLHTAFNTYQSSGPAFGLKSEKNRTISAEYFEEASIPPLSTLCLQVLGKKVAVQAVLKLGLRRIQERTFYDFIDENLPIEKCIKIDDDYYWKRVFCAKCTDKMLLKQKTEQADVSWKTLVIELKYVELLENSYYELWNLEEMDALAKLIAPYVRQLDIKKLQPMREQSFQKLLKGESESLFSSLLDDNPDEYEYEDENENQEDEEEMSEIEYDYPPKDCHHINLCVLGNMFNLNYLSLSIVPPPVTINYHTRLFNCSYNDIEHLASGISKLENLKTFKLRKTRMDSTKISTLLESLKSTFVEVLEFYFCQLEDDCGEALYEYLISTQSLKHLDLSGNYLRHEAIEYLTDGIEKSENKLAYLNLSKNRITEESLNKLTKCLENYEPMKILNLSAIPSPDNGAQGIIGLVKFNKYLTELDITAVTVNGVALVEALNRNFQLEKLFCQCCELTIEEEFKVEILLKRNLFKKANPYIGDVTKTEQEITSFLKEPKHPVYIKTLETMKKRSECLRNRTKLSEVGSSSNVSVE